MKIDIKHILSLPENERDDEIRKLISEYFPEILPKPWKHDIRCCGIWKCRKCNKEYHKEEHFSQYCPIPDRIALDWNLAMKMRDEGFEPDKPEKDCESWNDAAREMYETETGKYVLGREDGELEYWKWWCVAAQPIHYILAAIMAMENNSKEAENGTNNNLD